MSPQERFRIKEKGGECMKKIFQFIKFKIEGLQMHVMTVNMACVYNQN